MENSVFENLAAQVIGAEVVNYLHREGVLDGLAQEVETAAVRALEEIRAVLDDESLDDPACFRRVDAIVEVFHRNGLNTGRHDF